MRPLLTRTLPWLLLLPLAGCFDAFRSVPPPVSAASEAEKRAYQEIPAAPQAKPLAVAAPEPPRPPVSLLLQADLLEQIGQQLQQLPEFEGQPVRLVRHVNFYPEWIDVVVQDPKQSSHYEKYRWQDGRWQHRGPDQVAKASRPDQMPASRVPWRIAAQVYQQVLAEAAKLEGSGPIRFINFSMLRQQPHFQAVLHGSRENLDLQYRPDGRLFRRRPF